MKALIIHQINKLLSLRVLYFILFIFLVEGCELIFPFREPKPYEFEYYEKKQDNPLLQKDGVYYLIIQRDEDIDQYLIKFEECNKIIFGRFGGGNDSLLDVSIELLLEDIKDPEVSSTKGFYFVLDDIVKMEILVGDPAHGYYFIYYDGLIQSADKIIIKQTGYKRYAHAMEDEEYHTSFFLHERSFKFKKF